MKFEPGQSGNPAGRPKGAKHKRTLALMELLDGQVEAITKKMIDAALGGDMVAAKFILERLLPKERTISVDLTGANSPAAAMSMVLLAVANGEVTPAEADAMSRVVGHYSKAIEMDELAERVAKLEAGRGKDGV